MKQSLTFFSSKAVPRKFLEFKEDRGKLQSYFITLKKYREVTLVKVYYHFCTSSVSRVFNWYGYVGFIHKSFLSILVLKKPQNTQELVL